MSSDYIAKTIEAYDSAPDKFIGATSGMINHPEMQEMLGYMPAGNLQILDVGCGSGRDCQTFTDMGYATTGIDLSQGLLNKAQSIHPKLQFQKMDTRKLDFPNESFGGVWCNAVLLHLNDEDLHQALVEICRVLVSGGVVAVSLKEGVGSGEVVENFSSNLARFYNFKSSDELNDALKKAGFAVRSSHFLNERERFGPDKRDLTWIWSFATKPSIKL